MRLESMNSSMISWISQQGLDGSLMDQYDFMDHFDEELGHDFHNFLPQASNSVACSSTANIIEIPAIEDTKHPTPVNFSKFSTSHNIGILNFGNQIPCDNIQQVHPMALNSTIEEVEVFQSPSSNNNPEERVQPKKKKRIRPPSQTYDHIMAERRRREQLSQLFVALSALVPGLKKMDKSSILEDAIKHMKHLQERVKTLEEKAERKAMVSAVIVKKSQIVIDDDDEDDEGISDEQSSSSFNEQPLPEIEARVCNSQVLLKVHCEKHKDALANLICKVESLNLIVVSTNATPFGDVALDITIVAEMEKEFNLTVKEVVTALRAALHPPA